MRADLHMHSRWSDGSLEVARLIGLGKKSGLSVMAVTDHDTMEGQEEVRDEGRRQGMQVLNGVEISAFSPETGRKVHILGYNISDEKTVTDTLRPFLLDRHEAALCAAEQVSQAGYAVNIEDILSYVGKGQFLYKQHIMHALADRGYTTSIYGELYKKLFGKNGIAVIKSRYIPVHEAVRLVAECGGSPVLAHPYQYDSMDLVPSLLRYGLKGIEYCHPTQSNGRKIRVEETAMAFGLFLTGGSDAHGLYSESAYPLGFTEYRMEENHPLLRRQSSRVSAAVT